MKLTIKDRTVIPAILPFNGSMETMKICRSIVEKIPVTDEEKKEIGWYKTNTEIHWKTDLDTEIPLTDEELKLLKKCAKDIVENNQVTLDVIELVEKLMEA